MSDKSHQPHDPAHPPPPEQPAFPPQSLESGNFGASTYGPPGHPLPEQAGYPEYGAYGSPHAQQAFQAPGYGPKRPVTVLIGCIMAWIGAGFGILIGLVLLSISEDSSVFDEVDLDMSRSDVVDLMHVTGAFLAALCLIVIVMAVFAFRGAKWAAITLVVMAGIMVVLTLVSMVTGGGAQGAPGLIWSVVSGVLIYLNRPAREWFEAKSAAKSQLRTS
jgi:hypothetical protein